MAENTSIGAKGWFTAACGGLVAGLLAAQLLGTAGATSDGLAGPVVDRMHKGDRLTVAISSTADPRAAGRLVLRNLMQRAPGGKAHEGCEPPASPYVDPQLAKLPGRCLS